jgi:peptidoglycan-associated lipoprotein
MKKVKNVLPILAMVISLAILGEACERKAQVVGPDRPDQVKPPTIKLEDKEGAQKSEAGEEKDTYKISDLASEDKPRDLSPEEKLKSEIDKFESEPIYFDYDEWDLKSTARENLRKKAVWLSSNADYSILIEGHCDERGTNEYNLALGDRRAEIAKKYFVNLGIPEQRIQTISYGEEKPSALGHGEEAWAKNRRDEFRVIR